MSYCVNPVGEYVPNECNDTYAGGQRHVVLFLNDLPADPSNGVEVLAMIAADEARLITDVKIGIPLPSDISQTRYRSCSPETVSNYDRTAILMDDNVTSSTVDFYNSLNASQGTEIAGALLYQCDADRCTYIDKNMSWTGGLVIPDDNNDLQHFEFTAKWKSKIDPTIVTAPAGVFPA